MQLSSNGLQLIQSFEGFRPDPYPDSGQVPTIGFGTVMYPDGTRVTMDDPSISEGQALQYLEHQVNVKTAAVNNMITVSVSQNQFDALVSFAYNLGVHALQGSTLLRLLNSGDVQGAADEFPRWDRVNGAVISGLTRRRIAEQTLFLT